MTKTVPATPRGSPAALSKTTHQLLVVHVHLNGPAPAPASIDQYMTWPSSLRISRGPGAADAAFALAPGSAQSGIRVVAGVVNGVLAHHGAVVEHGAGGGEVLYLAQVAVDSDCKRGRDRRSFEVEPL